VTNTHPEENLKEADLIVDSLEKVGVSDLEKLLSLQEKIEGEGDKRGEVDNQPLNR